ncbi:HMA2 domain-containing protein [Oscillatoria salina]|uniref:HMA2 domain-containing protein n=1 Tax=Oscillatoria salina TaxID=331517 RepID=UPI0013B72720|nr:hypothetical protein [Oscillatoria salina]MBZ8179463.1 hypothetical protein [Oscillatoria salina IIICB1]NET89096.1 hypothetical protein [Kamptonema sp. SIO1D9]
MVVTNNGKMTSAIAKEIDPELATIPARIVSQTPGRLRFRLLGTRQPEQIERIAATLKEILEIYRVRTNLASGSITIFYARDRLNFTDLCQILADLNITFERQVTKGKSQAAAAIVDSVTNFNREVKYTTNGIADLRFFVPLTFSILAVRQLITKGVQLEIIPWYVFAWYAFDSFLKLHYTSEPKEE